MYKEGDLVISVSIEQVFFFLRQSKNLVHPFDYSENVTPYLVSVLSTGFNLGLKFSVSITISISVLLQHLADPKIHKQTPQAINMTANFYIQDKCIFTGPHPTTALQTIIVSCVS